MDSEDLITMLYWILGITITVFIIDWCWIKSIRENRHTERLKRELAQKNPAFEQIKKQLRFGGDGIIMVAEEKDIKNCALSIATLRRNGCQLPIIVYHTDNFPSATLVKFAKDVVCISLTKKLGVQRLRREQARIYALIYSPFEQVLLIEPDYVFLRNPTYLFQDGAFKQSGALFWKDYLHGGIWDKKTWNWVRGLIPYRRGDNRILDMSSGHYQSNDIVLFNKKGHLGTIERLWIMAQNMDLVLEYMSSDKELYWLCAELAKEPYHFVEMYPGVIGELKMSMLCTHVLYMDPVGQMLGFNGGLTDGNRVTDFTHYAVFDQNSDQNSAQNAEWTAKKCLVNTRKIPLPAELRKLFNDYAHVFHQVTENLINR